MKAVWVVLVALSMGASGCAAKSEAMVRAPATMEGQPYVPAGTAAIEGYVVDQSLKAIEGAIVSLDQLGLKVESDADGYYYLGGLAPGAYKLKAAQHGYEPHTVLARTAVDTVALYVFALKQIPNADHYQLQQVQKGFLACAITLGPPGQMDLGFGGAAAIGQELRCGAPRLGTGSVEDGDRAPQVEPSDRAIQRWSLDEPGANLVAARMRTEWGAGTELARDFRSDFGVDGCTDPGRTFGRLEGPSPLTHAVSPEEVRLVVRNADGTTCTEPGERCDEDACVLSTLVRPGARALANLRAGAAVQQVFEQQLVATFKPGSDA